MGRPGCSHSCVSTSIIFYAHASIFLDKNSHDEEPRRAPLGSEGGDITELPQSQWLQLQDGESAKANPKPVVQVTDAATTCRSCTLLNVSTELIIKILAYLPVDDLFSVQCTCRTIRDIIAGTACLQYIIRAYINGVNDFLPPDFPHSERLELLRRHEQAWSGLQLNLFTKCVINIPLSGRFTLQDGYLIYEILTSRPSRYGYADLFSATTDEELCWVHITMDGDHLDLSTETTFAVDHDLMITIRYCIISGPVLSSEPDKLQQNLGCR